MQEYLEKIGECRTLASMQVDLAVDGVEYGDDFVLLIRGRQREQNRAKLTRVDVGLTDGAVREFLDVTLRFWPVHKMIEKLRKAASIIDYKANEIGRKDRWFILFNNRHSSNEINTVRSIEQQITNL